MMSGLECGLERAREPALRPTYGTGGFGLGMNDPSHRWRRPPRVTRGDSYTPWPLLAGANPPHNDMEFSGERSESAATTGWAAVLHRPACLGGAWLPSGDRLCSEEAMRSEESSWTRAMAAA